jgi:hypothetical protein
MRKMLPVRIIAAAAMLSSVGLAVALPGAVAGARAPAKAQCTGLLGNATNQLQSGCTVTSGAPKIGAYGAAVVNGSDNGATIYWTSGKTTTESFTYTGITSTCPTMLSVAATLEVSQVSDITGGTARLTVGVQPASDVCIYVGGDGTTIVNGDGPNDL